MVIIVNHIAWSPSLFEFITGKSALFASAAEGFFVISGILVGYIYGPKILEKSRHTLKCLWKRAGLLYVLSVGFTLLFAGITLLLPESTIRLPVWQRDLGSFLVNTFTLRYSFGWTDFLARYSLFMLMAPIVLWLIAKRQSLLVAGGSLAVWLLLRENSLFLPFSAWQIIFVFGILIGYHLPAIERWFTSRSITTKQWLTGSVSSVALVTFLFSMSLYVLLPYIVSVAPHIVSGTVLAQAETLRLLLAPHFSKEHLDAGRLAIGVIWFSSLYLVIRRHEQAIHTYSYGFLEALGKRSLTVYIVHGLVIFAMDIFAKPTITHGLIINTLVTAATILGIYYLSLSYDRTRQSIARARQDAAAS